MEEQVLQESETVYSCLLCKMCEANCPAGVRIAENVRALRHHINRTSFGL
jgi:heterodisulfide reductase subunit C